MMIPHVDWSSRLCVIAIVSILIVVGAIGVHRTLQDPEAGPPRGEREGAGELVAGYRACQTFIAEHDGLKQVKVLLNDLGRRNRSTFLFTLHEQAENGPLIVSLNQDASEVNNNVYYLLSFPPIDDSAGKRYAFCLSAPSTDLVQAITVIGTVRDTYPDGRAVFTPGMWGKGRIEDLEFHLGYDLSPWEQIIALLRRLAAGKPAFLGAGWFYAFLVVSYLALLCLLFLLRLPAQEEDPSP